MKALLNEFKEFINRGNVMDMAVGVIIGGAFTAIVTSLTDSIINPLISVIAGGSATEISGLVVPGTNIDFGAFIGACINFLIVAAIVFAIVKAFNKAQELETSSLVPPPRKPHRRPSARIAWKRYTKARPSVAIAEVNCPGNSRVGAALSTTRQAPQTPQSTKFGPV